LDTKPCPSPIIIAASGGGSRAAFMTATVLGAILDLENGGDLDAKGVRRRIFGLSTVSGSSVAAAVIAAALHDAQERKQPDQPPCKQGVEDRAWFAATRKTSETTSWRDCLQKIVAGDVLSPVLVGLIYRDTFPLLNPVTKEPLWGDRAALLEQAMERRYNLMVTGKAEACRTTGARGTGSAAISVIVPIRLRPARGSRSCSSTVRRLPPASASSQVKSLPLRAGRTARRACFRWPLIYAR
jgi:hypothetical protein